MTLELRLARFREVVFEAIAHALERDPVCKPYEGQVQLEVRSPGYFERSEPAEYLLSMDCYVLGPGRFYEWLGTDIEDVFTRAEADIRRFHDEVE